jgi:hypothetical protein
MEGWGYPRTLVMRKFLILLGLKSRNLEISQVNSLAAPRAANWLEPQRVHVGLA